MTDTTTNQGAMARVVSQRAIRERATMTWVFSVILGLMALGVGALWPSMRSALGPLADSFPQAFLQFAGSAAINTPVGWINSELMSLVAPGCLIAVAVMCGIRVTADEERTGRLGLLLSAPVRRSSFVVGKLAGMVVTVAVASAALFVGTILGSWAGDMNLPISHVAALCVHAGALALSFGAITAAIGATTSITRIVTIVVSMLAFVSLVTAMFLPLSHTSWIAQGARLSPWHYFNASDPLTNGFSLAHLGVLAAVWLVASACAVLIFQRRDLRG